MLALMTERKSSIVHIKHFPIGAGKSLTFCRKTLKNAFTNGYGVSAPYGITCPQCLASYLRYRSAYEFRNFKCHKSITLQSTLEFPFHLEDKFDLDGEYWYKLNKMKGKLAKRSKYYDNQRTIHKSKKISRNK